MNERMNRFLDVKVIFAIGLIFFGLAFLLKNLGLHFIPEPWRFWPVILILLGFSQMLRHREPRQSFSGIVFILVGALFLVSNLELIERFRLKGEHLWPLLVIIFGIKLLTQAFSRRNKYPMDSSYINLSALMGGGGVHYVSKKLKGGQVTAIMGGYEINLKDADMEGDTMVIDIFAFWGGVDISVPSHWNVIMEGFPVMGGMEHKKVSDPEESPETLHSQKQKNLVIKGMAIMGGVEVKS
jgi:hypothetical protein